MAKQSQKMSGVLLAIVFSAVAALHAYWALGGTWALEESIGQGNPTPPNWSIWLVATLSGIAALGVLGQVGFWGRKIPEIIFRAGTWLLFLCLIAVTILNASTGRFWEAYVIAPLCFVLAALAFMVAKVRRTV